ncbi:hypothetical protein N7467_011292 [Penicillium canescens]|nr:hypothetical protein N7467_011292 [Penicillium canescens]
MAKSPIDQRSVLESFQFCLPREPYIHVPRELYLRTSASSNSTVETTPPLMYVNNIQDYESIWQEKFPKSSDTRSRSRKLLGAFTPASETLNILSREADVARVSYLQLLNPVNLSLEQLIPDSLQLVCQCEVSQGPYCRFDIIWAIFYKHTRVKVIAVLELKSPQIRNRGDFEIAQAVSKKSKDLKDVASRARPRSDTVFRRNATVLSKQAAKYGQLCDHVAIFDYLAMFIFDFSSQVTFQHRGEDRLIPSGCYFVEPAVSDRPLDHNTLNFRKVLWAFVCKALSQWLKSPTVSRILHPTTTLANRDKGLTKMAIELAEKLNSLGRNEGDD